MSLPAAWTDKIFKKMTLAYGRDFLARWEGIDLNDVKSDWSHELAGFADHPEAIAYALANLPPMLPLRVTFVGTPDIMPGIRLDGSVATVSRLATAAKHVAVQKNVGASNKITVTARMRGFDPAHHSITFKIDRGPGVIELADLVNTKTLSDGMVEKVAVFNLAAPATAYESSIEMTTNAPTRPFVVAHAIEVAQP